MATSVRYRSAAPVNNYEQDHNNSFQDDKLKPRKELLISHVSWTVIFGIIGSLMYIVHIRSNTLPEPKTLKEARPGEFIEERARQYLYDITDLGPREVGSDANEIHAVNYLMDKLTNIKSKTNAVHSFDIDLQLTSGSFTLKFLGEFSSVYDNVKNVIVKMGPKQGAEHSLLVNCHYDSVLDSPGASDDAVTCCLMLEVLDILSQTDKPLLHNIVFIFNGAEENILQASHGFITQHPWAKDVRAFVNLDSAGAGGRELLFQAGPEHPWLIQAYAQNVPHPFASTFAQEVFESGFIPSDTDFRIYRDYGNIPGLDIAYIHNGYVYHTVWDSPEMIAPGCIQRGGENLLALVRSIANSPLLADPAEYKHGSLVFFDVVGLFIVLYPARIGLIINTFVILIVLVGITRKVMGSHPQSGVVGSWYWRQLVRAVCVIVASWVGSLVCTVAIGYLVQLAGRPMAWYTHPWVLCLYAAPAVATNIGIHSLAKRKFYKTVVSQWDIEAVYFDASLVLMSVPLGLMTLRGINSAVLFLITVLLPLLIRDRICFLLKVDYRKRHALFMCLHVLGTGLPMLLEMYFFYGVLDMFIPVMGRIGPSINSDVFMAGIVSLFMLLIFTYQVSLVYVTRSMRPVLVALGLVFGATLFCVFFTPIGFPYGADPAAPSRQRHVIHHIDRTFHDISGAVSKQDAGIMMIPFDHYSLTPLKGVVPRVEEATLGECMGPYCGWPYYFAMICIMKDVYYMPAERLNVDRTTFRVVNRTMVTPTRERITIETAGPNHVNVYITPRPGVELPRWSVGNGVPHPTQTPPGVDFDTFFIYYSYGTKPARPWTFWLDLERVVHNWFINGCGEGLFVRSGFPPMKYV